MNSEKISLGGIVIPGHVNEDNGASTTAIPMGCSPFMIQAKSGKTYIFQPREGFTGEQAGQVLNLMMTALMGSRHDVEQFMLATMTQKHFQEVDSNGDATG